MHAGRAARRVRRLNREESEASIASRAFTFADLTAGALMTPRTALEAISVDTPLPELRRRLRSTPHARLPMYDGTVPQEGVGRVPRRTAGPCPAAGRSARGARRAGGAPSRRMTPHESRRMTMAGADDREVLDRINALVDEEHRLLGAHGTGKAMSEEERQRMQRLEQTLDQCWDLLRQRRGRRHAGQDPDQAEVRPPEVVERYRQ
jgi:hypothetical protein